VKEPITSPKSGVKVGWLVVQVPDKPTDRYRRDGKKYLLRELVFSIFRERG
jgi:hypothetical protein